MSDDKWRKIAEDLYEQVCINFCWHCGHERTREYKADAAVSRYRDAICDELLGSEMCDPHDPCEMCKE